MKKKTSVNTPTSVKVVAFYFLFSVLVQLMTVEEDVLVLGRFGFTGVPALFIHLLFAALFLTMGVGLWKLWESARRLTILYSWYALGSLALLTIRPPEAMDTSRIYEMVQSGIDYATISRFWYIILASLATANLIVICLVTVHRSAFRDDRTL